MGKIVGRSCKLYLRVSGSNGDAFSAADFTEVDATDLTLNLEASEVDANSRANNGWESSLAGLKNGNVDTTLPWDESKQEFTVFQTNFLAGTAVEAYVMSGDYTASGASGLHATMTVLTFTRNEGLNDMVTAAINLKPDGGTVTPEWVTSPVS